MSYGSNLDLIINKLQRGEDFCVGDFDPLNLKNITSLLGTPRLRISSVNIVKKTKVPKKMTYKQIGEIFKANLNVMNQATKGDIIRKEIEILHVHFFYHDYILTSK
jgi:hypothetical protein